MPPQPAVVAQTTRRIAATPERVFDAWLDTEKVRLWWTLSAAAAGRGATESVERVRIDARAGGSFSFLVRRNGQLIDHAGNYVEVERPRRLVFTWAAHDVASPNEAAPTPSESAPDYSRVSIDIVPQPDGCEVTIAHEIHPQWADFVERATNAWRTMLDAIAELLSEIPPAREPAP